MRTALTLDSLSRWLRTASGWVADFPPRTTINNELRLQGGAVVVLGSRCSLTQQHGHCLPETYFLERPTMPRACIFTITTGRSGTAYLASLLRPICPTPRFIMNSCGTARLVLIRPTCPTCGSSMRLETPRKYSRSGGRSSAALPPRRRPCMRRRLTCWPRLGCWKTWRRWPKGGAFTSCSSAAICSRS